MGIDGSVTGSRRSAGTFAGADEAEWPDQASTLLRKLRRPRVKKMTLNAVMAG
jgi:hypothetical protein